MRATISSIQVNRNNIPYLELEGSAQAPTIHFAPANGFPVGSYLEFLELFTDTAKVTGSDSRGVWSTRDSVTGAYGMDGFARELSTFVSHQYSKPVIGMGHSFGAHITASAAATNPELFSHLVLIEPASLTSIQQEWISKLIPDSLKTRFISFVNGSANRQHIWPNREAFLGRYLGHNTFKHCTDTAMHHYAHYGLRETDNDQFELAFDRRWEAYIFNKMEFLWKHIRKLQCPTLIIRAEHTSLYSKKRFAELNANLPEHISAIELPDCYHLAPLEQPTLCFTKIKEWLNKQHFD